MNLSKFESFQIDLFDKDLFKIRDGTSLVVINVYCPRVDPDKPERLTYKLNFFAAIEKRARSFLERGW